MMLETLQVGGNLMTELPTVLGCLEQLEELDISGMPWCNSNKEIEYSEAVSLYEANWSLHISKQV
jgi:Leucine-rich repeat (LRR) protein